MNPAPSSRSPARRPALPAFLGGRRPPGHTLVSITSLRGLHRLLLLSLLGQIVTIGLLLATGGRGERRLPLLWDPAAGALLRGEG
jgi:hypothetical protein